MLLRNVHHLYQDTNGDDLLAKEISPPTEKSTNRSRARVNVEPLEYNVEVLDKQPKLKNIKIEKVTNKLKLNMLTTT